jgi:hypothetical protein
MLSIQQPSDCQQMETGEEYSFAFQSHQVLSSFIHWTYFVLDCVPLVILSTLNEDSQLILHVVLHW